MQATKKSQNNFEKHNVAGLTCNNLVHMKTQYKAIIKTLWYRPQVKHIDKQKVIKNPEVNPHIHDKFTLSRFLENVLRKDKYFQQIVLGQMYIHEKINTLGCFPHIIHRNKFKEIIGLSGASTGDPTHDKVMWRDLMGKASQVSRGPLPEHLPPNQNLSVYCLLYYTLLTLPPFLWKELIQSSS